MILTILYIFLILVLLVIVVLMFLWIWTGFTSQVPFIPVPASILNSINQALDIRTGGIVYDLGCGDARVLLYIARLNKDVKYIGIENGPLPYLLAKFGAWYDRIRGKSNVQIIRADFFKYNLSNATHVFTYLYPQVMDDLLGKLDKELRPGTRLVSTSFKFTLKKEVGEIDLNRPVNKLARKLYIYEF